MAGSALSGCVYDPTGSKRLRSELNSEWLLDDDRLLFVLTGSDEQPARPAIWDMAGNQGFQFVPPNRTSGTMCRPRRMAHV
jgi:hypothetical protein